MNKEGGLMMAVHSAIIGAIAYIIMLYLLKQNSTIAEDRSALIAGISLVYMTLFGHNLPVNINKNILK
mgnify:CR=1 FL=1